MSKSLVSCFFWLTVYKNDIVDLFDGSDVRVKLYADDIKIYLAITNDTDCATLQTFIDKITVWSHSWQIINANTVELVFLELYVLPIIMWQM